MQWKRPRLPFLSNGRAGERRTCKCMARSFPCAYLPHCYVSVENRNFKSTCREHNKSYSKNSGMKRNRPFLNRSAFSFHLVKMAEGVHTNTFSLEVNIYRWKGRGGVTPTLGTWGQSSGPQCHQSTVTSAKVTIDTFGLGH